MIYFCLAKQQYLTRHQKMSDNEYDSELEEDALLSKLENITNNLKQIALHISATIREPLVRVYANNVIENLDKSIEQYNNEYVRLRKNKLIFFKIDVASLVREDAYFAESVYAKEKCPGEQGYFANMVFAKAEEGNFYRMHVEIWKYDNQIVTTNAILSRFEKNCMNELLEALTEMGFVSSIEGSAVTLRTKRPLHRSASKNVDSSINVLETMKNCVQNFLKDMSSHLLKEDPCYHCGKHLLFESKFHLLMPPTFPIFYINDKSKNENEQRVKLFHEACSLKFLKAQGTPHQFKTQNQRLKSVS